MVSMPIPYEFIKRRVSLSWRDVSYGLEHQFIKPVVAVERATEMLAQGSSSAKEVLELASLKGDEPVIDLVTSLSKAEARSKEGHVEAKWLYIVLAWLYENRDSLADPIGMVEEVYSDFGYPHEIASFIRYMPMVGPDLGSHERNLTRLLDRWKEYLTHAERQYRDPT